MATGLVILSLLAGIFSWQAQVGLASAAMAIYFYMAFRYLRQFFILRRRMLQLRQEQKNFDE